VIHLWHRLEDRGRNPLIVVGQRTRSCSAGAEHERVSTLVPSWLPESISTLYCMAKRRWTVVIGALLVVIGAIGAIGTVSAPSAASRAATPAHVQSETTGAVYDGDFPDPSVLVVGDRYYAYSTESGGENIQVISSKDLMHWSSRRDALPESPNWAQTGFTWAPAVVKSPTGGYEMFFAARDREQGVQCIGMAVSASPPGPFVDTSAEPFLCQRSLGGSIDPYVFVDGGYRYLIWKSDGANGKPQQLWSQSLSANDSSLTGTPSLLLSATSSWEDDVVEGPAMLQTGSGLFLYFSGNRWSTSAYSIGVVGCDTPLGPCVNTPTGQEVSSQSGLSGPGGPTFFVAPDGQTMMAYAAWTGDPDSPSARRELYMDTVDATGTVPNLVEMVVPDQDRAADNHRS